MSAKNERNFSGDFGWNITLQGSGETATCQKAVYVNHFKTDNFEHIQKNNTFIDVNFDAAIYHYLNRPRRIFNQRSSRSPQQIAQDLEKKLREGVNRRHNHLNHIIQKCRLQNEKVTKIRDKLAARNIENAITIKMELLKKEESAEQIRVKFINERVEKFRKQVRHAEEIKNRKVASQFFKITRNPENQHSGT